MGVFVYDTVAHSVSIEDRTLAHLRIVVMTKLRRGEPFMFDIDMRDGSGHRSYWIHPAVPLQFRFYANQYPPVNRAWIEALIATASGPNGLTLLPESEEDKTMQRKSAERQRTDGSAGNQQGSAGTVLRVSAPASAGAGANPGQQGR